MKLKKFFLSLIIIALVFNSLATCIAVDGDDNPGENQNTGTQTDPNTGDGENQNTGNNENTNNENQENQNNQENVNQINNDNNQSNIENQNNSSNVTQGNSNNESNINSGNRNSTGNANLKSLTLSIPGMSPEFNKDTLEYYLVVDLTVNEIEVTATPEDNEADVSISGNKKLEEGENTIKIIVSADGGNTKTYLIHVTKTDDIEITNADLKSLSIKGFSFYPSFKPSIYSYNLIIDESISKLDIQLETENEGATFEIIGNENLKEGENLIKIIVTAQNRNHYKRV